MISKKITVPCLIFLCSAIAIVGLNAYIGLHEDLLTVVTDIARLDVNLPGHIVSRSHNGPVLSWLATPFLLIGLTPILSFYAVSVLIIFFTTLLFWKILSTVQMPHGTLLFFSVVATWAFWYSIGGAYYDNAAALFSIGTFFYLFSLHRFDTSNLLFASVLFYIIFLTKVTVGAVFFIWGVLFLMIASLNIIKLLFFLFKTGLLTISFISATVFLVFDPQIFLDGFILGPVNYASTQENKNPLLVISSIIIPFNFDFQGLLSGLRLGMWQFVILYIAPYFCALVYFAKLSVGGKSSVGIHSFNDPKRLSLFCLFVLIASVSSGAIVGRLYAEVTMGLYLVVFIMIARLRVKDVNKVLMGVFAFMFGVGPLVANDVIKRHAETSPVEFAVGISSVQLPFASVLDLNQIADYLNGSKKKNNIGIFLDDNARPLYLIAPELQIVPFVLTYVPGFAYQTHSPHVFGEDIVNFYDRVQADFVVDMVGCSTRRFRISENKRLKSVDLAYSSFTKNLTNRGLSPSFQSENGCVVWEL